MATSNSTRQRRSGSTASTSGPARNAVASASPFSPVKPVDSDATVTVFPAELSASPFSLFEVNSLFAFGITLGACLVTEALFSLVSARLPLMGPVARVSRDMHGNWEFATLLSWKVAEITIGWFAGFNALEMALFTFVTNFPHFYFMWTFYMINWAPLALNLGFNTFASLVGFSYSRLLASDKSILTGVGQDAVLWLSTRLLSAALYAVPMLLSLYTWLPVHLAVYWEDLETLAPAHTATILVLAPSFLLLGHCTVGLILNPVVQHQIQVKDAAPETGYEGFDPAAASLKEHVSYNLDGILVWKHVKPSTWFLIKRTAVLAIWTTASAAFNACATLEGCDTSSASWLKGPALWGAVWGVGAAASGIGMGWVGGIL